MDPKNREFLRLLNLSGWSQSEAARQLQLTPGVVSQYVNEQARPSDTVLRLFALLVGSPTELKDDSAPYRVRPLDASERAFFDGLRALDDDTRRRVLRICEQIAALAKK